MTYQSIQPFPDLNAFEFPEIRALSSVWQERKMALEEDGAYKEFIKRLQREWAIETGIIERLYSWDRGVTEVLIEQGIESSIIAHRGGITQRDADHIQSLINDHLGIVEGLFGYIKGEEPLTEHFIRGLQAQFTEHQEYTEAVTATGEVIRVSLKRGEYKSLPNNPRRPDGEVHIYCPPERTKEEMEALIRMYREADPTHSPEIKSAWLHHRFTQIHPFQDGNGRVARALASLVFLREGLFPLVIRESDREHYISALEAADTGDLGPTITLFARRQRDAILKALGLEQQVQQSKYSDQIVESALQLLRSRYSQEQQKASVIYEFADALLDKVTSDFSKLVTSLDPQLRALTPPGKRAYQVRSNSANKSSNNGHYFQRQIIDIARQHEYFANLERYRSWIRITFATEQDFDYVISIHGYGPGDSGILAISAFTYIKAPREEGGTEPVALRPASTELFQFNYAESLDTIQRRFGEWLEASIAIALAEWKRTL